jgi:sulfonate transport system substrate-binding protein
MSAAGTGRSSTSPNWPQTLAAASKLSPEVAARQLERTDLSSPVLGDGPRQSIAAAAGVLKSSGVVDASVDLDQVLAQLFEPRFTQKYASAQ